MKIIKLISSNFKRLVAVEIEPSEDGGLVLVTGKNGMGKSSVLDAIFTTLGGGKIAPDKPIRDGEESAENTIVTENYSITRTFTEKDGKQVSKLVIKNAEGFAASSPQKLLDKIVGDLSFDPMKFIQMGETEAGKRQQRLALMKLAGLDFSDLNTKIANVKDSRADVRRDKERYEHEAARIEVADDTPDEEVLLTELAGELQDANDHNAAIQEVNRSVDTKKQEISNSVLIFDQYTEEFSKLEKEITALQEKAQQIGFKKHEELRQQANRKEEVETLEAKVLLVADVEEIQQRIANAETLNSEVRAKLNKADLTKQAEAKAAEYQKLGKAMKVHEGAKAHRLADATMPLEGLSVTDDCVVFGDIPLSQVNSAKQLEVGLGIAMAQNPELKVILMSGNDLDEDSLAVISKMTKDKGFQVWVERIEGEGGIVIEDGMVKQ